MCVFVAPKLANSLTNTLVLGPLNCNSDLDARKMFDFLGKALTEHERHGIVLGRLYSHVHLAIPPRGDPGCLSMRSVRGTPLEPEALARLFEDVMKDYGIRAHHVFTNGPW